ncbi:TetR/AcrR family transcriptional regulator [Ensifer sp. NBAIM29]|nr:TetR/AcrR family transcriptional regulator [Ensifer sp. NBAIM29]
MNTQKMRKYSSPLREAHTQDTRERILDAVGVALQETPDGNMSIDAVARIASVERRTVFRHFTSKEALLDAFWEWINARLTDKTLPESLEELLWAPRQTFTRFDREEALIRASLHTSSGREMRLRMVPKRREAFHQALLEVTRGLEDNEARRVEAIAHLLYSASAWETLRDYGGLSGEEAGETVEWALRLLVETIARQKNDGDAPEITDRREK